MKAMDLERLKEIFYGAIGEPPERRLQFVAEACGEHDDLRAEVTRLVTEHDRAGEFLESPFDSTSLIRFLTVNEGPLENGQIIAGRYRIVSLLGEGGMGIVYKAEDARLPRFVALKSLGNAVAGDPVSLERLRREAQAASTLNHPNICTIYDVVESEGRTFIVMEYLDGQTLKEMIRGGSPSTEEIEFRQKGTPLALHSLISIATQMIEGLEAAHNKGIVHRDIKPANIFVTKPGLVKILDFGIAQTARSAESIATITPTSGAAHPVLKFESHLTETGVAAGTLGYMSPEQLTARVLDARTDLFSFGAVLCEMATGVTPFNRNSPRLVLDSTLDQQAVPAARLNSDVPPKLGRIIERCLQKNPDLRYQSAADLRSELKQLAHEVDLVRGADLPIPDGSTAPDSVAEASNYLGQEAHVERTIGAKRAAVSPPRLRRLSIAACALVIAGGVLGFFLRPGLPAPRITGSTQLTHDGRDKERVVTDGKRIYYSSYPDLSARLYQVPVTGGDAVEIETSIPGPYVLDISPDLSQLLVRGCKANPRTSDCGLWTLPLHGGSPHPIAGVSASDAAWSPDGNELAYVKENELYEMRLTKSGSEKIARMEVGDTISRPRWSPDGTRLRFTVSAQNQGASLWEVSADGRNLHPLLSGWNTPPSECCGSWTPDGRYFLFQSDRGGNTNIWAIRESASILRKANHQPVQLTTGPTSAENAVPALGNGRLLVTTARSGELVRYDSTSHEFAPFLSGMSAIGVNFSRDGKWITYVAYPDHTLWRSRVDGSERLQLTLPPLYVLQPRWSPDGTRIAFAALDADKPWSVYVISANGGNLEQPVPGDHRGTDPTWSPDGSHLLFGRRPSEEAPGTGALDLEMVDLRSHTVTKIAGSDEMWSPRWSPDGRRILALPRAADRVLVFDIEREKWTELAKTPVSYPEWSRDGKSIVFLGRGKGVPATAIFRVRMSDHMLEQVASLRQLKQSTVDWGDWAGLALDDSPILLREAGAPDIYALDWVAP